MLKYRNLRFVRLVKTTKILCLCRWVREAFWRRILCKVYW